MATTLADIGAVPLAEMAEELAPAAKGVPVWNRDKVIVAFAMVDADDYFWVSQHRWHRNGGGYVVRVAKDEKGPYTLSLHRAIMGLKRGDPQHVDHKDHDPLNCQRSNLRLCTHAQNHQNRRRSGDRGSSSRFRGVSLRKDKKARPWMAYGCENSRMKYLGFYATEEEAAEVARAWRKEHMPYSND